MKLRPLGNRIIIQPLTEEQTSKAGIVLPDTVDKEKKTEGEVIAVGPGKVNKDGVRVPMEVKVGDTILFKKWGGDEVEFDKVEYKIISQEDVLAVLEK